MNDRDYGDEDPACARVETYDPERVVMTFKGVRGWGGAFVFDTETHGGAPAKVWQIQLSRAEYKAFPWFGIMRDGEPREWDEHDDARERNARHLRKRRRRIADIDLAIARRKVRAFFAQPARTRRSYLVDAVRFALAFCNRTVRG